MPLLAGCSLTNLSYREVTTELDEVVHLEGAGEDQKLVYQSEARQSPWYVRSFPLLPLKPLLRTLFAGPAPEKLENPSGHARELITLLAPKAGDDLGRAAEAALRLWAFANLDPAAINRIAALDGIVTLMRVHELDLLAGVADPAARPMELAEASTALDTLRQFRPVARRAAGIEVDSSLRAIYQQSLLELVRRPLQLRSQRHDLLSDLATAYAEEDDRELRPVTAAALRTAMGHCLRTTVLHALERAPEELQGDERWHEVRLKAIEVVHGAGGADAVPIILAMMVAPPEAIAHGNTLRFDRDPYVQLRLVHLCGQLDAARAMRSVLLPGRAKWAAVAPIEYLCDLILSEWKDRPLETSRRLPAQEALCRCLGRPVDFDVAWVEDWYDKNRPRS